MKKLAVCLFCLVCVVTILPAQWGVSLGYKQISASNWDNLFNDFNIGQEDKITPLKEGTAFGVDYWFRLKNYRIEFTPQLMYSRFTRNGPSPIVDINSNFYSLLFNTSFYALDMQGDCDCPTFSKDGNFFSKGFFFQVSPELVFMRNQFETEQRKYTGNDLSVGVGIGAGLDFGLSDFITVTPFVRYSYYPNLEWEDLHAILSVNDPPSPDAADNNNTDAVQLFLGLRLGFRFDELSGF